MPVLVSSSAFAWRCRNSGKCCQSYRVGVDAKRQEAIAARAGALPAYAGKRLFEPGIPGSFLNHATLAMEGCRCVFLRGDGLCDLHATFGEEEKPLGCRQYPYFAVGTPRGVSVGVFYSCPSAVATLREADRFSVLEDPPGFRPPILTKKVPDAYPLLMGPGRPVSRDAFRAIETWIVEALQDPSLPLPETLLAVRSVLETAARPEDLAPGPLPAPDLRPADTDRRLQMRLAARFTQRQERLGVPAGERDLAVRRKLLGLLEEERPRSAWPAIDPAWEGILRRYACGKTFGNLSFAEYGMVPGFQSVLVLFCLAGWVAQALAETDGRPFDALLVCDAIEHVERLFPQDGETFSLWSRKSADYETTGLDYARILLA